MCVVEPSAFANQRPPKTTAESIPLWIWGNAETCASIIAASIPMLRVLVRDVKSSRNYPSDYYAKGTGNTSRFVTISSRPPPAGSDLELHKLGDDGSERSILGNNNNNNDSGNGNAAGLQSRNGIMQVTDITIRYDDEDTAVGGSGNPRS